MRTHLLFYIPRECLKRRVRTVDLWSDPKQAHQSVAVIARKILSSLACVQALESERDELKLAQDEISFVVVDKLRKISGQVKTKSNYILPVERCEHRPARLELQIGSLQQEAVEKDRCHARRL